MISLWLIVALIAILYFLDDRVKFCVKYVFFVLFVMIASLVMILLALCKIIPKEDVANFDIARVLIINLMKIFRLKMNVQKVDNLQIDGPCIIVANHQSSLDLIGMMHVMPHRCAPLAKQELKWAGPFGFAAAICGTVFIDRLNHQSAMATMQRVAKTMTSQNIKIWIFPEGTRYHGKGMLPFKKGAFHLAVQAQIPIIPVVFSCFHNFYDKRKFFFQTPGEFTIEALPPIQTAGLTIDDVPDLMVKVREDMIDTYLRISHFKDSDLDRPETDRAALNAAAGDRSAPADGQSPAPEDEQSPAPTDGRSKAPADGPSLVPEERQLQAPSDGQSPAKSTEEATESGDDAFAVEKQAEGDDAVVCAAKGFVIVETSATEEPTSVMKGEALAEEKETCQAEEDAYAVGETTGDAEEKVSAAEVEASAAQQTSALREITAAGIKASDSVAEEGGSGAAEEAFAAEEASLAEGGKEVVSAAPIAATIVEKVTEETTFDEAASDTSDDGNSVKNGELLADESANRESFSAANHESFSAEIASPKVSVDVRAS